MKRIAFIEEAFMGSTLPLAKQFCKSGYNVDIYYIKSEINNPEGADCCFQASKYGITQVPNSALKQIRKYMESDRLNIFLVNLTRPYERIPLLCIIKKCILRWQIHKVVNIIDKHNYEIVNVIANYNMNRLAYFVRYINKRLILSLHEVCNHSLPSNNISFLLKETKKKNIDIIVFSHNNYKRLLQMNLFPSHLVHQIPFGLFESYAYLEPKAPIEPIPKKYILFYGHILPYKGLDLLKKAVDALGKQLGEFKIVIAGDGNDPTLKEIKQDDRFIVIQRYLSNKELVYLLKGTYVVVCPYKSMSQSGIPQTAFVFNIPIIASNLDGFREIINENNGMLFIQNDAISLKDALLCIIERPQLRELLSNNISNLNIFNPSFDWQNIKQTYEKLFLNLNV